MSSRRSPEQAFDHFVVVMTCCLWVGHLIVNTVLNVLTQLSPSGLDAHLARLVTYLIAIAMCLLLHRGLRRHCRAGIRFTVAVMALSVPAAILFVAVTGVIMKTLVPDPYAATATIGYLATIYARYVQWLFFTWAALYASASYVLKMHDIKELFVSE